MQALTSMLSSLGMVSVSSVIPRKSVLPCLELRLKQHLQVRATGLQKMLSCDLSGHFHLSIIAGRSLKLLLGWCSFLVRRQSASYPFYWEGSRICCSVYNQCKGFESRLFWLFKYSSSTFLAVAPLVLSGKNSSPKDHPMNCCQSVFIYSQVPTGLNFECLSLRVLFPILFARQHARESIQIIFIFLKTLFQSSRSRLQTTSRQTLGWETLRKNVMSLEMAFRPLGLPAGGRWWDLIRRLWDHQAAGSPWVAPIDGHLPARGRGLAQRWLFFAAVGKYCPHPQTLWASRLFPFARGDWFGAKEFQWGKNEEKVVFISSVKEPEDLSHSKTSD